MLASTYKMNNLDAVTICQLSRSILTFWEYLQITLNRYLARIYRQALKELKDTLSVNLTHFTINTNIHLISPFK